MRYLTAVVIVLAAGIACSHPQNRTAASPTSPTAIDGAATIAFVGGVSGPMDVLFPPRNESFQFRNDLETKYQGLGRPASETYVDREGEVVWMQEYIRYRVNGCDHNTATQRVMTQIDGGQAGGICSAPPDGLILFPSRADSLDFRRQLETKYQGMGRALTSTYVDLEGSAIWTQEYERYRVNNCDHATAEAKVFAQIDGGPVQPTCFVACTLGLSPSSVSVGDPGASGSFEVRPNQAGCNLGWTAASDSSWLTIPSTNATGTGFTTVTYNVAQNVTASRVGKIHFTWTGGSADFVVSQGGTPYTAAFTMIDPFRGPGATTECWLRSTATPCTLTATANLPGSGAYTYKWSAQYENGSTKTPSLTTSSTADFTITDTCGATGSSTDGAGTELSVTLTITDSAGNTITLTSGQGNQPALAMRRFTC
jgi:hypothetical protein